MSTINTIHDLIKLLREQPDWAEELRVIILTKELMDLPTTVASLAASVLEMNYRLANVEQDVATMKADIGTMKGDIGTMKGDIGRIKGGEYERAVEAKAIHQAYEDLGFIDPWAVKGPVAGVHRILSSTLARAQANAARPDQTLPVITDLNNFFNSDIIIADMGDPDEQERNTPPTRYPLFEVAVTADDSDVRRAVERSTCLAATLGTQVSPAVIAAAAPDTLNLLADTTRAKLFIIPQD